MKSGNPNAFGYEYNNADEDFQARKTNTRVAFLDFKPLMV